MKFKEVYMARKHMYYLQSLDSVPVMDQIVLLFYLKIMLKDELLP